MPVTQGLFEGRRQREHRYMRGIERAAHLRQESLPGLSAQGRGEEQEPDPFEELLRRSLGRIFDKAGIVPHTLEQRLQCASGHRIPPKDCDCRRYGNWISLCVEKSFLHLLTRLWARDGPAQICHMDNYFSTPAHALTGACQHFSTLR